jgi:hypothetical protein
VRGRASLDARDVIVTVDNGGHPSSGTALRLGVGNIIIFALLFERHELPQRVSEKTFSGQ